MSKRLEFTNLWFASAVGLVAHKRTSDLAFVGLLAGKAV